MNSQFYFRGRVDAQIVNGVLYIPREIDNFYTLERNYFLKRELVEGFRYLGVYPREELNQELAKIGRNAIKLPRGFVQLEKIVANENAGLKLHSALKHLALGKDSKVKIIGTGPYFEVWKQEDFERYESLADLAGVEARLAESGI